MNLEYFNDIYNMKNINISMNNIILFTNNLCLGSRNQFNDIFGIVIENRIKLGLKSDIFR